MSNTRVRRQATGTGTLRNANLTAHVCRSTALAGAALLTMLVVAQGPASATTPAGPQAGAGIGAALSLTAAHTSTAVKPKPKPEPKPKFYYVTLTHKTCTGHTGAYTLGFTINFPDGDTLAERAFGDITGIGSIELGVPHDGIKYWNVTNSEFSCPS